jgi:hypothetical protein
LRIRSAGWGMRGTPLGGSEVGADPSGDPHEAARASRSPVRRRRG